MIRRCLIAAVLVVAVVPGSAVAAHNDSSPGPTIALPAADTQATIAHDNLGAEFTFEPSEPFTCGGVYYGATVWYRINVPANGALTLLVFSNAGEADIVALHPLTSPTSYQYGPCDTASSATNTAELTQYVTEGASYLVQIGSTYSSSNPNLNPAQDPNCCVTGSFQFTYIYGLDYDVDRDGYLRPGRGGDCNDKNRAINPGARDIPHNGVDENCTGADNKDGDGDGHAARPFGGDCDDRNPGINPRASEVKGNFADENCDGRTPSALLDPFPAVSFPSIATRSITIFNTLVVKDIAPGYRIEVRCSGRRGRGRRGCPRRLARRVRSFRSVRFKEYRRRLLRPRSTVTIRVTQPGTNTVGKYQRYKVLRGKKPARRDLCIYPNAPRRPRACRGT